MTTLSIEEQDFLGKKAELQAAQQVAELSRQQQDLAAEPADLKQRRAQSSHVMANGEMTSDNYIALKR